MANWPCVLPMGNTSWDRHCRENMIRIKWVYLISHMSYGLYVGVTFLYIVILIGIYTRTLRKDESLLRLRWVISRFPSTISQPLYIFFKLL